MVKVTKKPRAAPSKLSFNMDEEEEEEDVNTNQSGMGNRRVRLWATTLICTRWEIQTW